MKPYWSDYVAHMTRFYLADICPSNPIDKTNYDCVNQVIGKYPDWLREYYIAPFVLTHSQWKTIKEYERKVAVKRGLIYFKGVK